VKDQKGFVTDLEIDSALKNYGWKVCVEEGRLMLAELILKAAAGSRNSHTEEGFLSSFPLLKNDRTPNKKGFRFLQSMFYNHSSRRPRSYSLIKKYRLDNKEFNS